jgi:hypothetical protein
LLPLFPAAVVPPVHGEAVYLGGLVSDPPQSGCCEGCCYEPQASTFPLVGGFCPVEGFLVIRGTG